MSTELLSFMQRERAPIIAQENLSPSPSFRVDISSYSGRQSIDSSASSSSSTNCSLTSGMSSGSDKNYHSHHIASQHSSKMSSSNNFSIDMLIAKATNHDSTNKHSPTSLPWNGLPAQNLIDLKRIQQYQQMLSKSCEMNPLLFSNYPTAEPNPLAMFAEYQQGLASLSHPVSSVAHLGMNTNDLVSYYASLYNSSAAAVSLQYLQRLKHYTSLFSSTASAATPSSAASSLFGLSSSKAIPSSSSVSSLITTATSTSQSSNATSTTTTDSASVKSAHHNEFDVSKRLVTPQLQSTTPNTVTTTTTTSSSSVSSRDAHSSTPTTPFCDYNSLLLNPSVAAVGLIAAASVAGSVAKSSQSQSMVNVQNSLVVGGDKSLSNHSNYSQRSLIEQGILSEMSEIQRSKVNPTDHHNQNEELYPGSGTDSPPLPPSTPTSAHHGESAFNQLFRKPKRIRTAFSPGQLLRLEEIFEKNRYVVGCERKQLARDLNLSETQIKVWFQNRRTKHKREKSFGPESQNMKFMNVSRTINNNS